MLESSLNLKNRITIDERSEEIVIRFFEFKVDSNIGWRTVFYTLLWGCWQTPYPSDNPRRRFLGAKIRAMGDGAPNENGHESDHTLSKVLSQLSVS